MDFRIYAPLAAFIAATFFSLPSKVQAQLGPILPSDQVAISASHSGTEASLLNAPAPTYPRIEACAGLDGTTVLIVDVDQTGTPSNVVIEKSSRNRDMDRAALTAARSWEFAPATLDGAAIPSRARVPVAFRSESWRARDCPNVILSDASKLEPEGQQSFRSTDKVRISLRQDLNGSTRVDLRWFQFGAAVKGSETKIVDPAGAPSVEFDMHDEGGWIPGKYGAEISLNGRRVALALFEIQSARWQEIGSDDISKTSVDVASIARTGDVVELWSLWNYDEPQSIDGPKFLSVKSKSLFNCSKRTAADADYAMYSERNGLGRIIYESSDLLDFKTPGEGSKSALLMKFACDGAGE